jgi:hypothetical protein
MAVISPSVDAPVPDARKGHLIGISSPFWKTAGSDANLGPAAMPGIPDYQGGIRLYCPDHGGVDK